MFGREGAIVLRDEEWGFNDSTLKVGERRTLEKERHHRKENDSTILKLLMEMRQDIKSKCGGMAAEIERISREAHSSEDAFGLRLSQLDDSVRKLSAELTETKLKASYGKETPTGDEPDASVENLL